MSENQPGDNLFSACFKTGKQRSPCLWRSVFSQWSLLKKYQTLKSDVQAIFDLKFYISVNSY
jgi:hypothetical protein